MAWTVYQRFLALMMVVTGSINTLTTKWADYLTAKGSDGIERKFEHPFLQALAMFLGEMLCLLVFKIIMFKTRNSGGHALVEGNQNFNPFILMPAAMFDLIGTSIMYVGLTLTYASSFQMFRGSVIIFVAVLSMTFVDKRIIKREWVGIACVILGLVIVGVTDAVYQTPGEAKGRNSLITGDLLIIVAQVVTACQMVYEEKYVADFVPHTTIEYFGNESTKFTKILSLSDEKVRIWKRLQNKTTTLNNNKIILFLSKYLSKNEMNKCLNIPSMQAVGWEGVFGFSVLSLLLVVFYWVPAPPHFGNNARGTVEDAIDGLVQIGNNPWLLVSVLGTIVSIAFFNFAGISVTKEMSATTRMVLDSVRTFIIWMVSLGLLWQSFHWQHLIGFAVLILGMCAYNGLYPTVSFRPPVADAEEEDHIVDDAAGAERDA